MAAPPIPDVTVGPPPLVGPPAPPEPDLEGFEAFWHGAWPWIWPTLALVLWLVVWFWLTKRGRRWVHDRVNPRLEFGLDDRFVDQLLRALFLGALVLGVYLWGVVTPMPQAARTFLADDLGPWMWPTLLLVAFVIVGFFFVRRGLIYLRERAKGTETAVDDAIVAAINRPLYLTVILLGFNLWVGLVRLPAALNEYVSRGTETTIVILLVLLVDGLVRGWLLARQRTSKVLQTSGGVIRAAVRIAIYVVGGLMALSSVGINVTPVLASLGVTSIAIGLALQGTLEDFLAGLLLAADQPIAVGDFVQLESEESGVVLSIGWRTTRILTRDDMHVIVPNSKVAKSLVVNRSRPREACRFTASCGVHYSSDLAHVQRVALEVAREVLKGDPRGVASFEPRVVFREFGASSIDFHVWLCARSWEEHFGFKSNFIQALKRRFDEEHITIPFPIRTLEFPPGMRLDVRQVDGSSNGSSPAPPAVGMEADAPGAGARGEGEA